MSQCFGSPSIDFVCFDEVAPLPVSWEKLMELSGNKIKEEIDRHILEKIKEK